MLGTFRASLCNSGSLLYVILVNSIHLVVDSWAKLESGILLGNTRWLGRYYECLNVSTDGFKGRYGGFLIGTPNEVSFTAVIKEEQNLSGSWVKRVGSHESRGSGQSDPGYGSRDPLTSDRTPLTLMIFFCR